MIRQRCLSSHSPSERACQKGREMMILFPLFINVLVLISFFQETNANFDDLGKLLFGGVAAAIVFAVGFTFVKFRLRDKKPPTSSFISISSDKD